MVTHGRRPNGKLNQVFRTFHGSRNEAEIALAELVTQVGGGKASRRGDITFAEAAEGWLAARSLDAERPDRDNGIDPGTLTYYRYLYRTHLEARLGSSRLRDLARHRLHTTLMELRQNGSKKFKHEGDPLSIATVKRVRYVLCAILDHAVNYGWIESNPAKDLRIGKRSRTNAEPQVLTVDEAKRLVQAARSTRLFLPILLAVITGARRGEILALHWADIDFVQLRLTIRRSLRRDVTEKAPKSGAGSRSFPLPKLVADELSAYRSSQERERAGVGLPVNNEDWVFCDLDGTVWKPNSIYTLYYSILKRAKIPALRFHDLRHSAASVLIATGLPLPVVSMILGHRDKGFTLRVYGHMLKDEDPRLAPVLESTASALLSFDAASNALV